jgi:hypothetical protein
MVESAFTFILAFLAIAIAAWGKRAARPKKLPPGPSLFAQILEGGSNEFPAVKYMRWSRQYGMYPLLKERGNHLTV